MQSKLIDSMPALLFAIFISIANFAMGLHYVLSRQPSEFFNVVYFVGIFWGLSWWLINDSQKYEWKWHLSLGNLLFAAGWLLVPFYLFKTRGAKAFLIILLFVGLYFGVYITGILAGAIISVLMKL